MDEFEDCFGYVIKLVDFVFVKYYFENIGWQVFLDFMGVFMQFDNVIMGFVRVDIVMDWKDISIVLKDGKLILVYGILIYYFNLEVEYESSGQFVVYWDVIDEVFCVYSGDRKGLFIDLVKWMFLFFVLEMEG